MAYASVTPGIVVTQEKSAPLSKRRVPLPDVCSHFNVECIDTFAMLRGLGVRLG